MKHPDTQRQRRWWRSPKATGVIAVSVRIVTLAERDIHRRVPNEIDGCKRIWQAVSLNAPGALAYLKWGITKPTAHSCSQPANPCQANALASPTACV